MIGKTIRFFKIFGHQCVTNKNTDYPQNVIINSFRYGQIICCASILIAKALHRAVVVAQLVTQTLPTPEVRDSNAVIGKNFMLTLTVLKREKIKKKRPGMADFSKRSPYSSSTQNTRFVRGSRTGRQICFTTY